MKIQNKHLLFRRFPSTHEVVMDRVIDLYQSQASLSKNSIATKVTKELGIFTSKKTVCELIDFARENCGVKHGTSESKLDCNEKMRFFKGGQLIRQVVFS